MYIYELPFEINRELCQLLDINDRWKELAGKLMKYTASDVNEIEKTALRHNTSPTNQLFIQWGQLNHRADELFALLYRMKHIPALYCLGPLVCSDYDKRIQAIQLLFKNCISAEERSVITATVQDKTSHNTMRPTVETVEKFSPINNIDEVLKDASVIPKISYEELTHATNNWSRSNILGQGGFGQVFKGTWMHQPVAIKCLNREDDGRHKELVSEMCLNQYRCDNILPLYGYSLGGSKTCLVYQFMAGGSLEYRLRGNRHPPLTWSQRYNIAHGVARGLQFLHTMARTPLIHGDIKPANILLDQYLTPRIGDFGVARKGPYEDKTHLKVSSLLGTKPYLPFEYLFSRCLSPSVDVYSYGVLIVEIATALLAFDKKRKPWELKLYIQDIGNRGIDPASLEDPVLRKTIYSNSALCREFFAIGLHCTKHNRKERPTMLAVFKRLDALLQPTLIPSIPMTIL